eukprot:TRINITY_DN18130_c0_g1_i2.p1 TRINITY_DN18130_c0_g1~~TRINITY_DN18130_c0_g1_i2.p1  ORF type:complete len:337 (+),score=54.20 TRINITY_DN18130_c0_g1_i2:76-1011(+)
MDDVIICPECTAHNDLSLSNCAVCTFPFFEGRPQANAPDPAVIYLSEDKSDFIKEIQIIDQWSELFYESIREFESPRAICGLVTCGIAPYIQKHFPHHMTQQEVDEMIRILRDPQIMLPLVREAMAYVQKDRKKYLENYAHEFNSEAERKKYQSDWVANYEISDWIRLKGNPEVHFVRRLEMNQVHHEELRRLEEEVPFRRLEFFIDFAHPSRQGGADSKDDCPPNIMCGPTEWLQHVQTHRFENIVFICDTLGHFVIVKPTVVTKNDGSRQRVLYLLNSSHGLQLHKPQTSQLFKLFFDQEIPAFEKAQS